MKRLLLALSFLFVSSTAVADAPAYRASATASGKRPTVSITPAVGDTLLAFALSGGHANSDLWFGSLSDNLSGTWVGMSLSIWHQGNGKYARLNFYMRTQQPTSTTQINVLMDEGNFTTIGSLIAVSGLSSITVGIGQHSCTSMAPIENKTMRQAKCNGQDQTGIPPTQAGETPVINENQTPWEGLAETTSLVLAVFGNESNTANVTAPSGFTSRINSGVTASGKQLGLAISTVDSGYTNMQTTWGSTTPTGGNGMVVEIQPLQ